MTAADLSHIAPGLRLLATPIDELRPDPANARTAHDVDKIAASLRQYGQRKPLVVNSIQGNKIEAGNGTYAAAKKLGWSHVAVVFVEDDPATAAGYGIADNRIAELSKWDPDALEDALLTAGDLLTGFTIEDIGALIKPTETPKADLVDPGLDVELADQLREKWQTEPGQVWVLGEHKLACLDSTNPLSLESLMGNQVARLGVTDPPWNVAIGESGPPGRRRKGIENDNLAPQEFAVFVRTVCRLISLHLSGDIYCVMSAGEWPLIDAALREAGMHWSSTIIWVKDQFVLARSKYHRRYEPIWYGWVNQENSTFEGGRDQDDVWEFPRPKNSPEHPTMKPPGLFERAIANSSRPGDLVLDPFGGSGTTLIACEALGRRARIIEKDPRYVAVTLERWSKMTGKQPVLA